METTEHTEITEGIFSELTAAVIGCAIEVHRNLGPGLLESSYQTCLAYELRLKEIPFKEEYALPIRYKKVELNCGYRIDLLVDECLVVEIKSVDQLTPVHEAQLLTYMKLVEAPVGLLINFNKKMLKQGIRRYCL